MISKKIRSFKLTKICRRCEYSREPCGLVLFHYIGDHVVAAQVSDNAPHGNAKRTNQPFLRTLPIILQEVKEQSIMNNNAVEVNLKIIEEVQVLTCCDGIIHWEYKKLSYFLDF